ncbi:hypothetical protein V1280_008781 [Bradyrhizobium sp. AZCC 2230]
MSLTLKLTRHLARICGFPAQPKSRRSPVGPTGRPKVLVLGIYMAQKSNYVEHLVKVFGRARCVSIEQRWVSVMGGPPSEEVRLVTAETLKALRPKWQIINELITPDDLVNFDYFLFSDDDVLVADDFTDSFFAVQQQLGFALAQPARTWRSFTDHEIVRRRPLLRARQTNFVEGGPVVSFRRDLLSLVHPFSLESPMGWGYDLTWPIIARSRDLRIGIIDCVPVDHSLRPRGALYHDQEQLALMSAYLAHRPHVGPGEVRAVIRRFW